MFGKNGILGEPTLIQVCFLKLQLNDRSTFKTMQ